MGFTASGITKDTVTTTQQAPLGFVLTVEDQTLDANGNIAGHGMQEWVYVFNDDAASFTEGTAVYRDPSATTYDWYGGLLTTAAVALPYVIGIAQHTIAAGSYGFILKQGVGSILAGSAGLAADSAFTGGGSAAGTVLAVVNNADATVDTNKAVLGHAGTVIGASAIGTAFIRCAG
tara:strand:- start:21 stop:548 length:528 start_codon:yes stop_codon:yes gene_type:complete